MGEPIFNVVIAAVLASVAAPFGAVGWFFVIFGRRGPPRCPVCGHVDGLFSGGSVDESTPRMETEALWEYGCAHCRRRFTCAADWLA